MAHLWIPGQTQPHPIVDDYSDAKHERHPHGLVIVDGKEVATTLQCPHCGGHFVSRKGSGHRRDICLKCSRPGIPPEVCCGSSRCHPDYYHGVLGRVNFELD